MDTLERPDTTAAHGPLKRRITVAEFDAMGKAGILHEDDHIELIDGEFFVMNAKGIHHEVLKMRLNRHFARTLPEHIEFIQETTYRIAEHTALEPDFVFYEKAVGLRGLNAATALLVVEIADSSWKYDNGLKRQIYASLGVRELWVIHAVKLESRIHRNPLADGIYKTVIECQPNDVLEALLVPGIGVRLSDLDLT